jgi:hypothetical protein
MGFLFAFFLKWTVVLFLSLSIYVAWNCFSLGNFKSFSWTLYNLLMMHDRFVFLIFGIYWAYWICGFMVYIKFWEKSDPYFFKYFYGSLLFSLGIAVTYILGHLKLSPDPWYLFYFKIFLFLFGFPFLYFLISWPH